MRLLPKDLLILLPNDITIAWDTETSTASA